MADFDLSRVTPYDPAADFDLSKVTPYEPPTLAGEFGKGVTAGVKGAQQAGYGLASMAGRAVGSSAVEDWGREGVQRKEAELQQDPLAVGQIQDIGGVKDAALWAAGGLGQLVPFMATSAVSGGVGGIVGGAVGKGLAAGVAKQAVGDVAKRAILQKAAQTGVQAGAIAGAGASTVGMETGSIYADQLSDGQTPDPLKALAYGIPAGLLDVLPQARLIGKVVGNAATPKIGVVRDVLTQMGLEGSTEAAQTVLERMGANKLPFSEEGIWEAVNAGAVGALGGGVMGGAGRAYQAVRGTDKPLVSPPAENPPATETPDFTAERQAVMQAALDPNAGPLTVAAGLGEVTGANDQARAQKVAAEAQAQAEAQAKEAGPGGRKRGIEDVFNTIQPQIRKQDTELAYREQERQRQAETDQLQRDSKLPVQEYNAQVSAAMQPTDEPKSAMQLAFEAAQARKAAQSQPAAAEQNKTPASQVDTPSADTQTQSLAPVNSSVTPVASQGVSATNAPATVPGQTESGVATIAQTSAPAKGSAATSNPPAAPSQSQSPAYTPRTELDTRQSVSASPSPEVSPAAIVAPKSAWEMTRTEYRDWAAANALENGKPASVETKAGRSATWDAQHQGVVRRALSDGKTVPAEVLADYPDLKESTNAPAQPVQLPATPIQDAGKPDAVDSAAGVTSESGTGGFDSAAWNKKRDDTIKASRESGVVHLDKVPVYVETMRGREVFNVHDPKERGVVRTVDNRGNVYINWSDDYSAGKNLASPSQEKVGRGKEKTVYQTSLGSTDLKDYAFTDSVKQTPVSSEKARQISDKTALTEKANVAPRQTAPAPSDVEVPAKPVPAARGNDTFAVAQSAESDRLTNSIPVPSVAPQAKSPDSVSRFIPQLISAKSGGAGDLIVKAADRLRDRIKLIDGNTTENKPGRGLTEDDAKWFIQQYRMSPEKTKPIAKQLAEHAIAQFPNAKLSLLSKQEQKAQADAEKKAANKAKMQERRDATKQAKSTPPTPSETGKAEPAKVKKPAVKRTLGQANNVSLKKLFHQHGININEIRDITGEGKGKHTGSMVGTFRKTGRGVDEWARTLVADGWLKPMSDSERGNENTDADVNNVRDLMRSVFDGQDAYTRAQQADNFQALQEAYNDEELAESGFDNLTADEQVVVADALDIGGKEMTDAEADAYFAQTDTVAESPNESGSQKVDKDSFLQSQTNAEAVAAEKAKAKAEADAAKPPVDTGPKVKADQVDMFNTHGGIFDTPSQPKDAPGVLGNRVDRQSGNGAIVDKDGQPVVVYHGTGDDISAFDLRIAKDKEGRKRGLGLGAGKIYLAGERAVASGFAISAPARKLGKNPNVMPVYVDIQKPLALSEYHNRFEVKFGKAIFSSEWSQKERDAAIGALDKQIKAEGYDGIVEKHSDGTFGQIAVFDPKQIRSAISQIVLGNIGDGRDLVIQHNVTAANLLHADSMGGLAVPSLAITKAADTMTNFGEITLIGRKEMADPNGYANTKVFGADIYSPRYPKVSYQFSNRQVVDNELLDGIKATTSVDWDEVANRGAEQLQNEPSVMWAFLQKRGIKPKIEYNKGIELRRVGELRKAGLAKYFPKPGQWLDKQSLARDPEFQRAAIAANNIQFADAMDAALRLDMLADFDTADDSQRRNIASSVAYEVEKVGKPRTVNVSATRDAMRKQIRGKMDEAFNEYAETLFEKLDAKGRIFQGFTYSGNRRYKAHTLDNVVAILKKDLRGGEGFNYGVGSLRAHFTPQFRTISQIRKEKGRLVSHAEFEKIKTEVDTDLKSIWDDLRSYHSHGSQFAFGDIIIDTLQRTASQGLNRALAENQFDAENVPQETKQKIAEFLTRLRNLPTEYFEAKITRAVGLEEFRAAVVPSDTSQRVLAVLKKRGIEVAKYKKSPDGMDSDRRKVVADMSAKFADDVLFNQGRTDSQSIPLSPGTSPAKSTFDHTLYGMVNKGATAPELLHAIATQSKSKLNRAIAHLLIRAKISPTVIIGEIDPNVNFATGNNESYTASYRPDADRVTLHRFGNVERDLVHELIHSSVTKALRGKGMAAAQMKALYAHVQKQGVDKTLYGMANVDEFVAEAFSNPQFQAALKKIPAMRGSPLKSAWEWFAGVVRSIVGIPSNQANAFLQALEIGGVLVEENVAAGRVGGDALFQRAWHGSPHIFDKFSTDKIGTGEGAQAYGWGLYFAGKKAVAEHYRKALAELQYYINGKSIDESNPLHVAAATLNYNNGDKPAAIQDFRLSLAANYNQEEQKAIWREALAILERGDPLPEITNSKGRLYQVDLTPKDNEWLDWDKPLSEQSAEVKGALKSAFDDIVNTETDYHKASELSRQYRSNNYENKTGAQIYKHLAARYDTHGPNEIGIDPNGERKASEFLAKMGIPGIRYLDGSSRNTRRAVSIAKTENGRWAVTDQMGGKHYFDTEKAARDAMADMPEQNHNYVIFDAKHVTIEAFGNRAQTTTDAFRKWFKDSKVVNPDGSPMVVYHGTGRDIKSFNPDAKRGMQHASDARGIYFTEDAGVASGYAQMVSKYKGGRATVYPVYVSLKNPQIRIGARHLNMAHAYISPAEQTTLEKQGYDGVIFRDERDSFMNEYIAFYPTQVKSATGNSGAFDSSNPSILGNRATAAVQSAVNAARGVFNQPPPTGTPAPGAAFVSPDSSRLDSIIYTMQDKHIDTRRVLEAIKAQSRQVSDTEDAYLQEELYHGRAAKETQDFVDKELKPLIAEMAARNVTMPDFEEFLHARHAEERNIQIAKINPKLPDGGSGMDTADARTYLAGLNMRQRADFNALASRIDAINEGTRQALIDYGLESQTTIDAWEAVYQHYVPLQREDQTTGMGIGQGFSVKGKASKRATGSTLAVENILANIALQRERAIVRGEKNVVSNALVGLAEANQNPDFWKVDQPPKIKYVDDRTGLVTETVDPMYKSRENVVMARMPGPNGEIIERAVIFNEHDQRAMRMAQALKNLDVDQLGEVLGAVAKATRYFAAVNTQYNPIFGVVNLTRDSQQAMFNLSTTAIAGKQADVAKNILPALKGIYLDLRAIRQGNTPASAWAQLFEEFRHEGGQTGYRDMFRTSDDRAEAIQKEFQRVSEGKLKQFGRGVFDWLTDYNDAMENSVRLAAYKVAKDSGLSNQRAASLAKNLTVNFNRKGQVATQAGALYAFFNASAQGTTRLAQTLNGPLGRKIIIGGITLGAVQALALAAAGFDDDDPPDFVRERSLIIPIGGKRYLTIPMPLGLHFIPNIGRIGAEYALSGFKHPAKRVLELGNVFADAFNPVGSAGLSLQTITPTVVDPLAALAENKDWTGKPIAREDFNQLSPTPGHTRAKDTASAFSKAVSKGLNYASGGTNYKPGLFSPTPDQLDFLIGQVTGGVGREAMKAEQSVSSLFSGEDLPTHKVPLVGRFYGNSDQPASQGNAFYNNLKEINQHENEIKGRRKAGEPIGDYLAENPEARLIMMANGVERQVSQLRKRKRELTQSGADRETIKAIDLQISARMKAFNDRVKQVSSTGQ